MAIRGRFLLDRGVDLVDGPGGSETAGGVAANAHGNLAALAGLRVAQGEARAVSRGLDGTELAGDPVVLADEAYRTKCVSTLGVSAQVDAPFSAV